VLVVKEGGRTWWDLPGGGMDHGESIQAVIAREMKEEVNMQGEFSYKIIAVDEPGLLLRHLWQIRLVFAVQPRHMVFSVGKDSDEIAFKNPQDFKASGIATERRIYNYYYSQ